MKQLTTEQRNFLEHVKDQWPFATLNLTIPRVLNTNVYSPGEAQTLNKLIKKWKERKKQHEI